MTIASVWTDGGTIGVNPSKLGGAWAWLHVGERDERLRYASGAFTPAEVGSHAVTNNLAELLAVVIALEGLPDGWDGVLYTDSLVTFYRVSKKVSKFKGIPDGVIERLAAARARVGKYKTVLVKGHPTKKMLARGVTVKGVPVSSHNVYVDNLCGQAVEKFGREKGIWPFTRGQVVTEVTGWAGAD